MISLLFCSLLLFSYFMDFIDLTDFKDLYILPKYDCAYYNRAEAGDENNSRYQVFYNSDFLVVARVDEVKKPFNHYVDHFKSKHGKYHCRENSFLNARSRKIKHRADYDKSDGKHNFEIPLKNQCFYYAVPCGLQAFAEFFHSLNLMVFETLVKKYLLGLQGVQIVSF